MSRSDTEGEVVDNESTHMKSGVGGLCVSTRVRKPSVRYLPSTNYLLMTKNGEPKCYLEALKIQDAIQWKDAMKE